MKSEFENPREFWTRRRASPKVQGNFGLDTERVRKSKGITESMKGESLSPKEFQTRKGEYEIPLHFRTPGLRKSEICHPVAAISMTCEAHKRDKVQNLSFLRRKPVL